MHIQQNQVSPRPRSTFNKVLASLLLLVGIAGIASYSAKAVPLPPTQNRTNIALGKKVLFSPAPGYSLTKKGGTDATDLTDGKLSQRADHKLWFESVAVGWSYGGKVNLAVDLGKQSAINEIAIRFLNGTANSLSTFPGWVEAFVSDDGVHYSKVAEFSRWNNNEFKKFDIGQEGGKSYVDVLRFKDLNAQGRFVGLRFYGSGITATDELYVFGKPSSQATKSTFSASSGFTVTEPQVYFHKPYLELANNVALPVPIGIDVPANAKDANTTLKLDLPPGLKITGGKIGGIEAASLTPKVRSDGWSEYIFPTKSVSSNKVFGRLYLIASGWKDGQNGELRYQFGNDNWQSPSVSLPVHAVNVPAAPRLKKIMASMGWWSGARSSWPNQLEAFRTIGLNTFNVFSLWMPEDTDDPQWKRLEKARQQGFFISNIDSTFRNIVRKHKGDTEMFDQFQDGTVGKRLCISYRGKYYQQEIQRFATMIAKIKPDFSSEDIELWGWRGPTDSMKCMRCQADFKKSGLGSWAQWQQQQGQEMLHDLMAATQKAGVNLLNTGLYDVRPGMVYQQVFDFDSLYPEILDVGQVSTYTSLLPSDLVLIGDVARRDRSLLPRSDVMPWLSPGDAGVFPGEDFQWALLECYTNGSRGIWFWSSRMWDSEDLIAYNKVIRAIAPVENVIVDGNLVGASAKIEGPGRISGMRLGSRMVLLAADYFGKSDGTLRLQLDLPAKSQLCDLMTGETIGKVLLAGSQSVDISLNGQSARLLEVVPVK